MKVIKTLKTFYKTQPYNSKTDPTKLKKSQILSFKINGNETSKLPANILIGLTFYIIIQTLNKVN